jgi:lipoate-protein ligase A
MVNKLYTIVSNSFNPYHNIALEKHLFDVVDDETVILYLWQNERTVVCGRNQNVWKECRVSELLGDDGHPARRLSGGGAVFHDLGNLNFTFLVTAKNYDVDRQLEVIITACKLLGIDAQKTGRNDITVEGHKFSGNAFYKSGTHRYHHGTLMVKVDLANLSTYLNVDPSKLKSKGVDSVRSRVVNLSEYNETLTIDVMKEKMFEAAEKVYNLTRTPFKLEDSDKEAIAKYQEKFGSDEWLYGRKIPFEYRINNRFPWGDFDLNVNVNHGIIETSELYSDANDEAYIRTIGEQLEGKAFSYKELSELVDSCVVTEENKGMAEDIKKLLFEAI